MLTTDAEKLIDELFLPNAQGGRKSKRELSVAVVRPLGAEDIAKLGDATPTPPAGVLQLRHGHHQLAMALAKGTDQETVALMTGYSPAYISKLRGDPTFRELMAYYEGERELQFVEVLERMRSLGLSTLDELQARLAEDSAGWTKRELMELAELMLVKPQRGAGTSGPAAGSAPIPALTINFVAPQPVADAVPVLELESNK